MKRLRLLAVFLLAVTTAACSATPPFEDASGKALPRSVAAEEMWTLNGIAQSVLVRGSDVANPVLVLLHGGPGVSETALFRAYVPQLERSYLVLYWDQPGAGRSYTKEALAPPLTMERILDDLDALVDRARERFGREKVVLLGHSWGSALGVLYAKAHPEKVAAYVGTGQVASMPEGEGRSYRFALEEAERRGETRAVAKLREIGPPPHDVRRMLESRHWVERFGGTFANGMTTGSLIGAALCTPEASVIDLYRFGAGNRASLEALWPEFSRLDLAARVTALDVPVFLLLGDEDHVTPTSLAVAWFERLQAPCKRLHRFPGAAHNVPFEKPREFVAVLEGPVREVAMGGRCPS